MFGRCGGGGMQPLGGRKGREGERKGDYIARVIK